MVPVTTAPAAVAVEVLSSRISFSAAAAVGDVGAVTAPLTFAAGTTDAAAASSDGAAGAATPPARYKGKEGPPRADGLAASKEVAVPPSAVVPSRDVLVSAMAAAAAVSAAVPTKGGAGGTPARAHDKADDPAVYELEDVSSGSKASCEAIRAEAEYVEPLPPEEGDAFASGACPPPSTSLTETLAGEGGVGGVEGDGLGSEGGCSGNVGDVRRRLRSFRRQRFGWRW